MQPPPPIRTFSTDSQSSGTMSPGSEALSPTSTSSRGRGNVSPAEESFFGAIAEKMRRGRSRSRSNNRARRSRSKSPLVIPPEQLPLTPTTYAQSPTVPHGSQQPRLSQTNTRATNTTVKPTRPSLQGPSRRSTSGSDMWRGRHSNEWLFGGFSVTEATKDLFHIGRKPSS